MGCTSNTKAPSQVVRKPAIKVKKAPTIKKPLTSKEYVAQLYDRVESMTSTVVDLTTSKLCPTGEKDETRYKLIHQSGGQEYTLTHKVRWWVAYKLSEEQQASFGRYEFILKVDAIKASRKNTSAYPKGVIISQRYDTTDHFNLDVYSEYRNFEGTTALIGFYTLKGKSKDNSLEIRILEGFLTHLNEVRSALEAQSAEICLPM